MQKTITTIGELKLIGITTRTSNAENFAGDPQTNKISLTVQKYFHNRLAEKIDARKKPGTTFCVYTNYESDEHGEYTYFIGEEVNDLEKIPEGFEILTVPDQAYIKFTSDSGQMPTVCIDMWHNILKMNTADIGGERSYIADFEVYDERSRDPNNTVLDIYIGIKK